MQIRGSGASQVPADAVSQVFENAWESTQPVTLDRIVQTVCDHLNLTTADLASRDRGTRVSLGRGADRLSSRRMTDYSYPEIARALERHNHSSAHAAARRIETMVEDKTESACPDKVAAMKVGCSFRNWWTVSGTPLPIPKSSPLGSESHSHSVGITHQCPLRYTESHDGHRT